MMKPRYFIQTFGCQMNVHDSERMAGMLDGLGYDATSAPEDADVILMNTCAVRERPEHKLYSELGRLRRLKQSKPNLVIGVAGCMAQREANTIRARVPEVDILLGPRALHHLPHLVRNAQQKLNADGLDLECDPTPVTPVRRASTISAYVDIIFGCNFKCTYCAVPSARGREVSRPPGQILDEVRQLCDLGYREITLLGQTVNAYGHDLAERRADGSRHDFASLLEAINAISPELRVRFTSPHPMYFTQHLIDVIASTPSVCEHLHLPLQSGSNECLKRMKRTYSWEKYRSVIESIREKVPGVAVTTDAIVGFCGESEAEFSETMRAFEEIRFDQAFMFAYSPRHSTESWAWEDDVPAPVKTRRLRELIERQNEIAREKNRERIGERVQVLVEGLSQGNAARVCGRTRQNKLVMFDGDLEAFTRGSLAEVQVREGFLWGFVGEAVPTAQAPRASRGPRLVLELPVIG